MTFFRLHHLLGLALAFSLLACDNPYSPSDDDSSTPGQTNKPSAKAFTIDIAGVADAQYGDTPMQQACAKPNERTQARADKAQTALKDVCTQVVIAVYGADHAKVSEVAQNVSDANFGHASVEVPNGTYTVVVIAHNGSTKPVMTKPDRITFGGKLTDTFYCCQEVTAAEGQSVTLVLTRAVALLRLQTNDATPANISTMRLYYTGGSSTFNALTGLGCVNSKQTEERAVPATAYSQATCYDAYTFPRNDSEALNVTASALDKNGTAIFVREFKAVPIERNRISLLEGKFYGESAEGARSSFDISIDSEWNSTLHFTYGDGSCDFSEI